jgi:hypothetical protein
VLKSNPPPPLDVFNHRLLDFMGVECIGMENAGAA